MTVDKTMAIDDANDRVIDDGTKAFMACKTKKILSLDRITRP